jgi:predicted permease
MDEEIRLHIEHRSAEYVGRGLPPQEARTAALREFGGVESVKEAWRGRRRGRWLKDVGKDLKSGVRVMRRRPGFAVTSIVTLALGAGLNVAVFSAVRAVLLDDLPYPNARSIVEISQTIERMKPQWLSPDDLDAIRSELPAFSVAAGATTRIATVKGAGDPERLAVSGVTPDFFRLFGRRPEAGRAIGAQDLSGDRVVVIGDRVRRSQFGDDPDVVGRSISLDGQPWIVVGVMPSSFAPTWGGGATSDIWIPLQPSDRDQKSLAVFAMLNPGVTLKDAQAQVDALARARQRARPPIQFAGGGSARYNGAQVSRLGAEDVESTGPGLLLLQGVAGLLLLLACANLANLFLAHGLARQAELGTRVALGADRWRLVRQLLTEAAVVAIPGSLLGVAIAQFLVPVISATDATVLPKTVAVQVGGPELALGVALVVITTLLFAAVPALIASSVDPLSSMRGEEHATAGRRVHWLRGALVTSQVLIALLLLLGAGLLIKSFVHVFSIPQGFDSRDLVIASVDTVSDVASASVEQRRALVERLQTAIRNELGPIPTAFADRMPYGSGPGSRLWSIGASSWSWDSSVDVNSVIVSPTYFDTLQIPFERGRGLSARDDRAGAFAAVVNDAFVRRFAKGRDLLGTEIRSPSHAFTIVGIADDVRTGHLTALPPPTVYTSMDQEPISSVLAIAVRSANTTDIATRLRAAVGRTAPDALLSAVTSVEARMAQSEARRRFYLLMASVFGALAGVLATVGIYSVATHNARLRERELGIRLTLGAAPATLKLRVIGQGLLPVAVGVIGGVVGAWWVTRLLQANAEFQSQLFEVTPHDPSTFLSVCVGAIVVGGLACWIPARVVDDVSLTRVLRGD